MADPVPGTFAALLRAVNVGGTGKLAMADLRRVAGELGWRDARTYVASGNLVFRATGTPGTLAQDLGAALKCGLDADPGVLVLTGAEVAAALAACPWPGAEGRAVHVLFLFGEATLDRDALQSLRAGDEDLRLDGRIGWLLAPGGIGRSKLGARLGRVIRGAAMTGRNLNTLRALAKMVDEAGPA